MQMQSRVLRDSLPLRAADQRLGVDVHEVHLAMGGQEGRQVQVVAVAGPEDAETRSSHCCLAGEYGREASPMLGELLPLVPAGRVEGDLTPAESIHESRVSRSELNLR